MSITLGTNIPSMTARFNLNKTTDNLTKTMERLSTGLKINRAGDDAAGLVISQNMEAEVRGSKQAMSNIQNAQSFLTVAEDGMVSITDHCQRINDLLIEMANDSNSTDSRIASVQEIIERIDEIDRLVESTDFNGKVMLDGSVDSIIIQMGSDSSELSILDISRALTDCHTKALGIELPANLNPDAVEFSITDPDTKVTTTTVLQPVQLDDGSIVYKEKASDDTYYTIDDPTSATPTIKKYTPTTPTGEAVTYDAGSFGNGFDPTNANCRAYMENVQNAINTLSTNRGLLGAYENRMTSSYDSMSIRVESLETAKSYYTDADIAEEATNLTSQQILEQMNTSVLTIANNLQQTALTLIGA